MRFVEHKRIWEESFVCRMRKRNQVIVSFAGSFLQTKIVANNRTWCSSKVKFDVMRSRRVHTHCLYIVVFCTVLAKKKSEIEYLCSSRTEYFCTCIIFRETFCRVYKIRMYRTKRLNLRDLIYCN